MRETSYLPFIVLNTLSKQKHNVTSIYIRSGLLVYNVIFIGGPERLGPKRLGAGLVWGRIDSIPIYPFSLLSQPYIHVHSQLKKNPLNSSKTVKERSTKPYKNQFFIIENCKH